MPAFTIIVAIGVCFLWFAFAPWFRTVGGFLKDAYDNAKNEMNKNDDED